METSEDIRISLAGVQDKLAVVVNPSGRIGLPRGTTPSTHILKPASTERRGRRGDRLAYPALVANEAMCLTLARHAGIEVPELQVLNVDDEPALLIARYDRRGLDGRLVRLHQEDFCQALGIPSRQKYEADGGPGLGQALDLIRRYSSQVVEDTDAFVDRVAFNYLIGNCDAHAKNFSLLYARDGTRLSPAYDLLSTEVYDHLSRKMAMSI